jgi:ABC-2 type transport system ATP-binding protein
MMNSQPVPPATPDAGEAAIRAVGLVKRFGPVTAVDGMTFDLAPGRIYGLLGPNGSGKTTLIRLLTGMTRATEGTAQVLGVRMPDRANLARIGYMTQGDGIYPALTAGENAQFFGAAYGVEDAAQVDEALRLVELADRAKTIAGTLSGGQRRRLSLACALVHKPPMLFLDEPTVGVDPQSRNAIFDNLETLKKRGKTLLYTTHYMEEAERLCDRMVIIDHGKVIADDTLQGLHRLLPVANILTVELEDSKKDLLRSEEVQALPGVQSVEMRGGTLSIGIRDLAVDSPGVLQWLVEHGHPFQHFVSERASLETVFLTLTGRSLRD